MKFNQVTLSPSIPLRHIQLGFKRAALTHNGECKGFLVPLKDLKDLPGVRLSASKFLKSLEGVLSDYDAVVLTRYNRPVVLWVHPRNYTQLSFDLIGEAKV